MHRDRQYFNGGEWPLFVQCRMCTDILVFVQVRFFSEETLCIQVDPSLFPHKYRFVWWCICSLDVVLYLDIVVLLQPLAGRPSLGESSTTLPVLKGVIHSASWEVLDDSLARSALRACHHLRELTLTHQAGFMAQELTVLDDPEPCIAVLNVAGSYGPQVRVTFVIFQGV